MKERFLHYIWQHKLFYAKNLISHTGEALQIIDVGKYNTDAGPDFFNAKIKVGDTVWAGNVEIHVNASDWQKHAHHTDLAYNSVILHVVYKSDAETFRTNGELIPQLELRFPSSILDNFNQLDYAKNVIPCASKLPEIDSIHFNAWLDACLTERLTQKTESIYKLLQANNNNWEEAFYITLARNFGFGTNSDAFEWLAKSLPLACLGKHKDNLFQLEALLFGQSGLLSSELEDEYAINLYKEYVFLRAKFNLDPMDASVWKLLRLRPDNFPHVRIAQFASLVYKSSKLFSKIIEHPDLNAVFGLFESCSSEYWQYHYLFGEKSPRRSAKLGKAAVEIILINTVVPFLFLYGQLKQNQDLQEKALSFLEQLPAERNSLVREWVQIGVNAKSAYDTQALIQWMRNYCQKKDCLRCAIGHKILTTQ